MGNGQSRQDSIRKKTTHPRQNLLLEAARTGLLDHVKRFLTEDGVHVDAADNRTGLTALMLASGNGHIEVVRYLLEKNANIEATDNDHCTALYCAALFGRANVTKLLLDWNANIVGSDENLASPLLLATQNNHVDVVSLLLNHKTSIKETQENKGIALLLAAVNGNIEITKLLLDRSANVNHVDPSGETPLTSAAMGGHLSIVEMLLEHGAAADAQDDQRKTALDHAIKQDRKDIIQVLQSKASASRSGVDRERSSRLMIFAARIGSLDLVMKTISEEDANVNASDDEGYTALMYASRNGYVQTVQYLLEKNAKIEAVDTNQCTPLMLAAQKGHIGVARMLLDQSANIEAADEFQQTSLIFAAENGHFDMVMLLMDRNANVNLSNNNGGTSIAIAAHHGHFDIVRLLLTKNANANSVDAYGDTPLLLAAMNGHASIVKLLLENGANPDVKNLRGKAALDCATEQNRKDIMQMLLSQVETPMRTDTSHQSALSPEQIPEFMNVVPVSLDEVGSLCTTMHEATDMCVHIQSRLFHLGEQILDSGTTESVMLRHEYEEILERFHVFLVQYGNKRIVTRIVSGKVIISVCQRLHEELDDLIKRCDVNIFGGCLEWKEQFQADSEIQRGLLGKALKQTHLLENELHEAEVQTEALTLMLFELNHRAGQYEPSEIDLINRIFHKVARFSRLGIPSLPSWFIPPHEVELDPQAFQIGRGSYGLVHRGSWIGTSVVVKSVIFQKDFENREMFLKEADIWSSLQHPHIVKLFGACHVGNPFFVCEYASNGNLPDYLYDPEHHNKTWKCLHDAALGLWYLHSKKKIVHRDIKGDNIVVSHDGIAKLTDFGLSCREDDLRSINGTTEVGAIRWKAPECISNESSGSFVSDVYSFGMTIIEAVTGRLPFGMMSDVTVKIKVVKQHELPNQPAEMNVAQWNLIKRMCSTNPGDRIDMAAVVRELKEFAAEELDNHLRKEWENDVHAQKSMLG